MDTARRRELWKLARRAREECGAVSLFETLYTLSHEGLEFTVEDVGYLAVRLGEPSAAWIVPEHVARFVSSLVSSREATSVLDPRGGVGFFAAGLSKSWHGVDFDVFTDTDEAERLRFYFGDTRPYRIVVGNPTELIQACQRRYEAIVSCPLGSLTRQPINISTEGGLFRFRAYESERVIAESAALLVDEGCMIIGMPSRSASERRGGIRPILHRLGLHMTAVLHIGVFGYGPAGRLPRDLVVVERRARGDLFAAQVPEDEEAQHRLIERLRERSAGPAPGKGRLVPEKEFRGFAALEAGERMRRLAERMGLKPVRFREAIASLDSTPNNTRRFEAFEEEPDSVYLPKHTGRTRAVTSQAELPDTLKSYYRLKVNRSVVDAEYLTRWLNMPIGRAFREANATGITQQRIGTSQLREATLYLPTTEDQRRCVEAIELVQAKRGELAVLEARIWESGTSAASVLDDLKRADPEERFRDWVEGLHFPMASMLRAYLQASERSRQIELLRWFFERLAEYIAVIHLSAFRNDPEAWREHRPGLVRALAKCGSPIERPAFASWKCAVQYLTKRARTMLDSSDELVGQRARDMYRVADLEAIGPLVDPRLSEALEKANTIRNQLAHGAPPNDDRAALLVGAFQAQLETVRQVFVGGFSQLQLVRLGDPRVEERGAVYPAEELMGSNPEFVRMASSLELLDRAPSNRLYLWNPGHNRVLRLLPLVTVACAPKSDREACFFYTGMTRQGPGFQTHSAVASQSVTHECGVTCELIAELSDCEA